MKQHLNEIYFADHPAISNGTNRCNLNSQSPGICLKKRTHIVLSNVHQNVHQRIQTDWFGYGRIMRDCSILPLKKGHFRAETAG